MLPNDTERRAAETLIERGVRVTIPAPRFFRLFGKREIGLTVKQPTLRTLLTVSALSLKAGFSFEGIDSGNIDAAHQLIRDHARTLTRIVAVFILNKPTRIKLFAGILSCYLANRLTAQKITGIVVLMITFSGVQDFTNSIRLIRSMSLTTPRNLSPEDQGSQEATR